MDRVSEVRVARPRSNTKPGTLFQVQGYYRLAVTTWQDIAKRSGHLIGQRESFFGFWAFGEKMAQAMWLDIIMLQLKKFTYLETDLTILLLMNIILTIFAIRKWSNLKPASSNSSTIVCGDDFMAGFDVIDLDETIEEEEEDITLFQHGERPQDISVSVECTYEASDDNRDLL